MTTRLLVVLALLLAACGSPDISLSDSAVSDSAVAPTTTAETTTTTVQPPATTPISTALRIDGSPMVRFSIEVGAGVELDRDEFTRFVVETLADERSWVGRGAGFELLDEGGDFTMIVALPDDVDAMCAPLQTNGRFSCARNGWIAFNSLRWFGATDDWPSDLETYRRYLVNHEVGHYIVGPAHETCPGFGEIGPVMMQQTKGLDGCVANGWVDP